MKNLCILVSCLLFGACTGSISASELEALDITFITPDVAIGGTVEVEDSDIEHLPSTDRRDDDVFTQPEIDTQDSPPFEETPYPAPPYAVDTFQIMPNMSFYNPWEDNWITLEDFYQSETTKALLVVSSAGWCGPCLGEAAALVEMYEEYHQDGLEIVYTLGNTQIPGDVPFDLKEDKDSDLEFMKNWIGMVATEAKKSPEYGFYADPLREFLPYKPNHAWPLSVLLTTKDMGVRLVEVGYWSALMENKIMLVLYNEVPTLPFE